MSTFPIQMQTYDPIAIKASIDQFNTELNEEQILKLKLQEQDSDTKILEATQFVQEYGETIINQYHTLKQLDATLRQIVVENKTLQEQDTMFNELINTPEYLDLASKMGELKNLIASLDSFLVEQNVKGPPL